MEYLGRKDSGIFVAAILVMAAISYYFFLLQQKYPPCCDAVSYAGIAAHLDSIGFLKSQIPLRTFAYPLFLSGVAKISAVYGIKYPLVIFILQLSIYIVAVANVMLLIAEKITSNVLKSVLLSLLCCNIYVAPYVSVALTDSLYLSLCLIVLTNICRLLSNVESKFNLMATTVFLTALAIVVRPAAIWLVGPLIFCLSVLVISKKTDYLRLISALAIAAIPLGVQIFINYNKFDVFTFFPATDLGAAQIEWGIKNLKYATWMGDGVQPNYYPSNSLINITPGESGFTAMWYFNNALDSTKLVLVKFIGAFDFDYLVPYPYFKSSDFWIPSILSFMFMFFGLCGVIYHALTGKITALGHRFLPIIILASWGAVTLISALELRFTLPVLCYFMIVSVLYIYELNNSNKKLILFSIGGFFLLLPVLIKTAMFVRDQSSISG
jgi:hypothetical protein